MRDSCNSSSSSSCDEWAILCCRRFPLSSNSPIRSTLISDSWLALTDDCCSPVGLLPLVATFSLSPGTKQIKHYLIIIIYNVTLWTHKLPWSKAVLIYFQEGMNLPYFCSDAVIKYSKLNYLRITQLHRNVWEVMEKHKPQF